MRQVSRPVPEGQMCEPCERDTRVFGGQREVEPAVAYSMGVFVCKLHRDVQQQANRRREQSFNAWGRNLRDHRRI